MNKIPTIFERDWDGDRSRVLDIPHYDCQWVFDGEGRATRKYDGTCVMYDGRAWSARREVKAGKSAPADFVPIATDPETGDTVGWEPIGNSAFAKFFHEAVAYHVEWEEGTYELIGPKINKNPEQYEIHFLIKHDDADGVELDDRTYDGISRALLGADIEGIVFHHPDGRMAKIKARDFGIKR